MTALARATQESVIASLVKAAKSEQLPRRVPASQRRCLLFCWGSTEAVSCLCRALALSGTFQEDAVRVHTLVGYSSCSPRRAWPYRNILFWDTWLTAVGNQNFTLAFSFCKRLYCVTTIPWSQRLSEQVTLQWTEGTFIDTCHKALSTDNSWLFFSLLRANTKLYTNPWNTQEHLQWRYRGTEVDVQKDSDV